MKTLLAALTAAAALFAFAANRAPAAAAPTNKPAAATTNTLANAAATRDSTDEIDLEEVDDSAEARAKAPVVTAAKEGDRVTLVDITCDNATLEDVLRQFRKVTDANIISDDSTNLQRRVSVNLHRVPWLDGLQSILNSRNYRIEERGSIYFIKEDKVAEPILTRSFTLNHASAKELAELFNNSYGKKDPRGVVTVPIATSFDGANVVVVTATEKTIADCESIIRAVDKAVAQIYIEARFLELSSEAMHKLGLQWNQLESWGASVRNISGGWEVNNGRAANYGMRQTTRNISNNPTSQTAIDGEGKTTGQASTSASENSTFTALSPTTIGAAEAAGLSAADMAWRNARGFSGQLSVDDFRLALSAFESIGEGKVFSNPKVIVSNGKEAKVDMTTKYPNVTVDSNYTGQNSQNLSVATKLDVIPGEDKFMFAKEAFFSWGIQLSVTPRISPDGLISVEIVPTISDCSGYVTVNSSQESDTPYTQYPIIEVKRLTTEFTMKDGSTAVIGGLSRTSEEDIDSGIPYLRKIPWIGPKLFGWKSRGKVQKEIVVCVTIGIANPAELPRDIGLPKNAILGREYVEGRKLEPGDRKDPVEEASGKNRKGISKPQPFDNRISIDVRKQKTAVKQGEVVITPAVANASEV